MNRLFVLIIIFSTLLIISAPSECRDVYGFDVSLFMDKQRYHISEDIMLNVQIKNTSGDEISFFIYDSPERTDLFDRGVGDISDYTTFKPVIYDLAGRNEELIVPYIISGKDKNETIAWMKKREIKLGPGETFTHIQNLKKIYNLSIDKNYRIKMHFFPFIGDAGDDDKIVVSSNELRFKIVKDKVYAPFQSKKANDIRLNPSEVIHLMLTAERDGQWDRMFKYIDIDKYIHSYPDYSRRYDLADEYDKKIIEKEFTRFLITKKNNYLVDYRILNEETEDSGRVAYVTVMASRNGMVKKENYKYTFRLEKNIEKDYIWMVSGLDAIVVRGGSR